jgi:DNA-directed RNA polymerase subunit RPC12/RpoP
VDLGIEFQKIYDSEINVSISWLWDGGIDIRLGDEMNGFVAEQNVASVAEIVPWLQEAIARFHPMASYTESLNPELKERAAKRLFLAPKVGARVICPYCGSPHAKMMDEVFQFICAHCGSSVAVDQPKIQ